MPAASSLPTFRLGPGTCAGGAPTEPALSLQSRDVEPCGAVPGPEPLGSGEGPGSRLCFHQLLLFPSRTAPHVGILYLNQDKQSC